MGYIFVGLITISVGFLLFITGDSPATMESSEVFGLLLIAAGLFANLIGMVTHVVAVNRADKRRP